MISGELGDSAGPRCSGMVLKLAHRPAGHDAITAVAASFYGALPDMHVFFDDLVVDGERIEYHWTFTGTNTGPGGTGDAVRVQGSELWTIDEDGLIAASLGSYDAQEYARQLDKGV